MTGRIPLGVRVVGKWGEIVAAARERKARRAVSRNWSRALATTSTIDPASDVVVSLTSYPPRYETLSLTIKSLLTQTAPPAAVLLWIAEADMPQLPPDVLALQAHGLDIRACEDLRSFKKFIPAIRSFPQHRIAICDDDSWYRPTWLAALAAPLPIGQIACHRIHRIAIEPDGRPGSYDRWEQGSDARDVSALNFPTGVGGVLFHPDQLDPRVVDDDTARALCPSADDIWLYWMGRLGGSRFVRVGRNDIPVSWRGSQRVALWRVNTVGENANDRQVANMIDRFGSKDVLR